MNINVDETKKKLRSLKAEGRNLKLVMFGGSLLLFPQPVREISEVAEEIGAIPCYDAAHVAGLIAGGQFQDPLREGAHLMNFGTHKTLFGPQGGTIVGRAQYGESIKKAVFPGTSSNHIIFTTSQSKHSPSLNFSSMGEHMPGMLRETHSSWLNAFLSWARKLLEKA